MTGYDQKIKVRVEYAPETINFLNFLQVVGRKYSRKVKIKSRYQGRGYFYLTIDGGSGGVDSLFQELLLNRGLYYYSCTLENKEAVVSNVILPVFKQLIDNRFSNSQSRFLRKHILGKHAQTDFIPANFKNEYGCKFEVFYRKWDVGMTNNKDYVVELDTLLHQYLLETLGHREGDRSDPFPKLLERLNLPFELHKDFKDAFLLIHTLRTGAVHRLELPKSKEDLGYASTCIYNFFTLLDELKESNAEKFILSRGNKYKRLKYGDEDWNEFIQLDDPFDWDKFTSEHVCHDCFVRKGNYHISGCDVEQCPKCLGQLISCTCKFNY